MPSFLALKRNGWTAVIPMAASLMVLMAATATAVPAAQLPPPVQAFLDRYEQCEHWAGEEGYDEARRKEIEAAFDKLRCETIDLEKRKLEQRYKSNPSVLEALQNVDAQ